MSKKEMKRQKKKAAAGKDLNKPEDVKVVGAVDYGKDFFARRANLTVSGQLNVETHACALSDVYTFGPTFRAENSHTGRHLSEFWMIEPEIAFADLNVDINLAEDYLKYCVQFALDTCADDLEFFENNPHGEVGLRARLRNVLDNPFKVRKNLWSFVCFVGRSWRNDDKKHQWESLGIQTLSITLHHFHQSERFKVLASTLFHNVKRERLTHCFTCSFSASRTQKPLRSSKRPWKRMVHSLRRNPFGASTCPLSMRGTCAKRSTRCQWF